MRKPPGQHIPALAAVRDNLAAWMKTYPAPPDIVLIHLGTNDQNTNDFNAMTNVLAARGTQPR